MRKTLSATILTLALAGGAVAVGAPAFAQSGQTQTPNAPNAGNSAPQPANSLPPGAGSPAPGSQPGTTTSAFPTLNNGTSTTTVAPSR